MDEKIAQLQEWIDESTRIVFFGEQEYLQKVVFQIFAALTACITRNMIIPLKRCSVIRFSYLIRKSSSDFTGISS